MARALVPRLVGLLLPFPLLVACAAAPPRADDLSAETREQMANERVRDARQERAEYHPDAIHSVIQCRPQFGECQSITYNPTDRYLDEAADDEQAADVQLALAESLRLAEAKACAGLPADDHATSPFHAPVFVVSVKALGSAAEPQGAAIVVHEPPGTTLAAVQQRLACHLAYTTTRGHVAPEMPDCPLVPRARAEVLPEGSDFVVFIRGEDGATDREILRRARTLLR